MKANKDDWDNVFKPSFDVPTEVSTALDNYLAEVKPTGSVEQHFDAHLKSYWAWIDSGQAMADVETKRETYKDADNHKAFRTMNLLLKTLARTPSGKSGTNITNAVKQPIAKFLSECVHDSFEHFSATGGTLQTDVTVADYYHIRKIIQPS
jgi:hypothetical protein